MTPQQVVEKYFELVDAAMSTADPAIVTERAGLVSDDIEYRNMPLRTIRGIEEHREWKSGFAGTEYMRGTVTHIAADGEWVLMRRDEEWCLNGVTYRGTVMATMRVVDGRSLSRPPSSPVRLRHPQLTPVSIPGRVST